MATNPTFMPVDYTGTSPSNRIHNEQHILNLGDIRDHRVVIPKFAPFYSNTGTTNSRLQVRLVDSIGGTNRVLEEGLDYYLVYYFRDASRATGSSIFGAIEILNDELKGIIVFDYYQSLGGIWNISHDQISEILANRLYNPRITTWEEVANPPERFPIVDHEWDIVDMVGMSDVKNSIDNISTAIHDVKGGGIDSHILDKNNPHEVTPEQIGAPSNTEFSNELGKKLDKTGTAANAGKVYGLSKEDLYEEIKRLTVDNAVKLDGLSLNDLTIHVLQGTAYNSARLAGLTVTELTADILAQISSGGQFDIVASDSHKLGGLTLDEVLETVSTTEAYNSARLEGLTLDEIIELLSKGYAMNTIIDDVIAPGEEKTYEIPDTYDRIIQVLVQDPYDREDYLDASTVFTIKRTDGELFIANESEHHHGYRVIIQG